MSITIEIKAKCSKKYYCIKQHDIRDCGAACLATVSKQYGLKIPITKIREVAGTDKKRINEFGMIKAAEKLGFSAKGVKGNKEEFLNNLIWSKFFYSNVGDK
ncbi:hypothetical protein HLPR_16480 [Helicovermis profundi]|uniref:Peptidase C39 domain-containing protein n=1 Tax=Helicovermis profundi TaxID=3065157 RepID=A0AAU9E992_9FIRM|nr:hypothetical protein HLPR_16480 [Clostridia bacterium S502]